MYDLLLYYVFLLHIPVEVINFVWSISAPWNYIVSLVLGDDFWHVGNSLLKDKFFGWKINVIGFFLFFWDNKSLQNNSQKVKIWHISWNHAILCRLYISYIINVICKSEYSNFYRSEYYNKIKLISCTFFFLGENHVILVRVKYGRNDADRPIWKLTSIVQTRFGRKYGKLIAL